ncbi:MBL fold metallo-hydrolase [Croceitalea marina]|uniref:MBL fold metallo-hydrolase n=1 Tax=Croceitalea marina TaxID=1775166 RepID=A0ABW5MUU7_9FLAO
MKKLLTLLYILMLCACNGQTTAISESTVTVLVLGTIQDAGSPHIGCKKTCCSKLFQNPDFDRKVVSLGVIDHEHEKTYLFEATPDMPAQLKLLKEHAQIASETPSGIFVTHAHIGHYTGLMYLGREALGAQNVPVYAMPKMKSFIENNGPWSQLVNLENIELKGLQHNEEVKLTSNVTVIPFLVPHRDEFSETVGYKIIGPNKSILFIPDINKWSKWDINIIDEIKDVDFAFLDATFYDGAELNNRDISEIPHPFIIESLELFKKLSKAEKDKIHFIHFNHTNPVLNEESRQTSTVLNQGFHIAQFGQRIRL